MPLRYQQRLLRHIAHANYTPADLETLADDLGIDDDEREDFRAAVRLLAEAGQLILGDKNLVTLPPFGKTVIGAFKKNARGFGFIIPRTTTIHGDLFVPPGNTLDAVTGDIVKARVIRTPRGRGDDRSPFVGDIIEVVERKRAAFTGELIKRGGQWLVFPDGSTVTEPVVVRDAESKNAREGLKVAFEMIRYPEGSTLGEGVITRVLGEAGRPDVETQAVIEAYDLPGEFPSTCIDEARELSAAFEEVVEHAGKGGGFDPAERMDLRGTFICTIDPPDAKDYDDALSIERVKNVAGGGPGWRLGVHIADVANFVTPGTALDTEAAERGNSCYLPRLVIPMLPEVLSNGICSLQEGVPRYCKSAFIEYDEQGRVRATGFASTVIHSSKRLTYLEAQALIDGDPEEAKKHARSEPSYTDDLLSALREMDTLSKRIRERRRKAGMIHLDLPDVELVFDEDGRVVDAVPEDNAYTHTLIEMFMVEANEAVARLFEELGVPLLRRTHPEPIPGAMDELGKFVKVAGYKIPKNPTREELQALLDATTGTAAAPAVHIAVLRTLTRAEYSPALIGHFALASSAYAHFTSPIRRYPDLTVHRALAEFLARTDNGQNPPRSDGEKRKLGKRMMESDNCPDEQTLVTVGNTCNRTEENAESAERELRQFLVLQLLEGSIGESFPGIVTGVTNAGVFVRLDKYLAEGLCKAEDLPVPLIPGKTETRGGMGGSAKARGSWQIDRNTGALVEKKSGRSFSIGDRVDVTIASIDLARRKMDLTIMDSASREVGKPKKIAERLTLGEVEEFKPHRTGADKRAARSRSRDQRKTDYRKDRKDKGKR